MVTVAGKDPPFDEVEIEISSPDIKTYRVHSGTVYGSCSAVVPRGSRWRVSTLRASRSSAESPVHLSVLFIPIVLGQPPEGLESPNK
ncbi:MAG: hypothetical protein U0800_14710 [Isosphaeraceae bacterium]